MSNENIKPLHVTDVFLYPLKTSENQRFSGIFRGYRKTPVAWDELTLVQVMQKEFTAAFISFQQPSRHLLVQSLQWKHQNVVWNMFKVNNNDSRLVPTIVLVSLLSTFNRFHIMFCSSHCLIWTSKCRLAATFKLFSQLSDTSLKLKFYCKAIYWVL